MALRRNLLELLAMGSAHIGLDEALRNLRPADAFRRPAAPETGLKSAWELLEHMRIGQEDIVRYTLDPAWQSPPWPKGYWPSELPDDDPEQREQAWSETMTGFRAGLEEVRGWIEDENFYLTAELPHGQGRTYLRQVLLVADHNAYHLGQIVTVRRLLGLWP